MKQFLFLLAFLFFMGISRVDAASLTVQNIDQVYANQTVNGTSYWARFQYLEVDSKVAYCVEPGVAITTNYYQASQDFSGYHITNAMLRKIQLIAYFGYQYKGHDTIYYYMATQELIWRTLKGSEVYFTTKGSYQGDRIDISIYKNEILRLIEQAELLPSFHGTNQLGVVGETLLLTDTNHVVQNYTLQSVLGNQVDVNGSEVTITILQEGQDTITFNRALGSGSSMLYFATGSQSLISLGGTIEMNGSLTLESELPIFYGQFEIYKYGDQQELLEGVRFGIYKGITSDGGVEIGELLEVIETDQYGYAISNLLEYGTYFIKELETQAMYELDVREYMVELNDLVVSLSFENYKRLPQTSNTVVLDIVLIGIVLISVLVAILWKW